MPMLMTERDPGRKTPRVPWTYKGVDIYPVSGGSTAGIRWYARNVGDGPTLRADTKAGMRDLINHAKAA